MPTEAPILLTGATGYVAGRLLPLLVDTGWRVRCLARQPERLAPRAPAGVEVVAGDVLDAASLPRAMQGVKAAYYRVHSMGATENFETQDRIAADNFAAAAGAAGVQRIIYLGDATWLWTLRGWLDLLLGGVGMRRGRHDPEHLKAGDTLDCWRVESASPNERLRLSAEMKLPGRAWLEFEVKPCKGGSELRQTATFAPLGWAGLAYWYGVWPLHQLVFAGMLRGIARAAEQSLQVPKSRGRRDPAS